MSCLVIGAAKLIINKAYLMIVIGSYMLEFKPIKDGVTIFLLQDFERRLSNITLSTRDFTNLIEWIKVIYFK